MYASRLLHQLVLVVSILYVAQASWLDLNKLVAGRQLLDVGASETVAGTSATGPTSPAGQTSTSGSASSTVSKADPASSSSTKQPESSSSETPAATSSHSTSTPAAQTTSSVSRPQSSSSSQPTSTNNNGGDKSPTPTPTPVVATSVVVVTGTNSDGSRTTMTSTSTTTSTPGLSANESGETSGMSPKTRNTVIGVVVGVGGAIVLGALGLVAWRVWGRKKNTEESDGLMAYSMNGASMEKPEPASSASQNQRTPFQSTLENYHQPTAPVNASSNF